MKSLWPTGQAMGMEEFINDPRLVKWFAQNYDLVGCNLFTCSNILTSSSIVSKVVPVPIGIDFHSMTEKGRKKLEPEAIAHTICNLRLDIEVYSLSLTSPLLLLSLSLLLPLLLPILQ